jgi:hypothetical protein
MEKKKAEKIYSWSLNNTKLLEVEYRIQKDLDFNYRLPVSFISLLSRTLTKVLNSYDIHNPDAILECCINVEQIIKLSPKPISDTDKRSILLLVEQILSETQLLKDFEIEKEIRIIDHFIADIAKPANSENRNLRDQRKNLLCPELHFENGQYLHSTQYFFAKRYFQCSENCDKLAVILANKIMQGGLKNITLVGFRGYIGLLLEKTKTLLGEIDGYKIDYTIIEQIGVNKYSWQFLPDFSVINTTFLIVLPITCTSSTYVKIRKHLEYQIDNQIKKLYPVSGKKRPTWKVSPEFFIALAILDKSLLDVSLPVLIVEDDYTDNRKSRSAIDEPERLKREHLKKLYKNFDWAVIERNDHVYFRNNRAVGMILVKIYSELVLSEECKHCFPDMPTNERNIFLTHDNYETPNLIQDLPCINGAKSSNQIYDRRLPIPKSLQFTKIFPSKGNGTPSHQYGHIKVFGQSFLHFIRGNKFFEQNRDEIIVHFADVLRKIIEQHPVLNNIVFITSENQHNSTFLDELIVHRDAHNLELRWGRKNGKEVSAHILRIDTENEFVDNFMATHINMLDADSTLLIFYEDIFSAGKGFKVLSNYIKHYKNSLHWENNLPHGFDYVFTCIDRTPYFTHYEILKKLYSKKNFNTDERFQAYFKLNVPVVSAAHLGDPFTENNIKLKGMLGESHLDLLKRKIGFELSSSIGLELPEENIDDTAQRSPEYFPFEDIEGNIKYEDYKRYKEVFSSGKFELLKLYVAHQINTVLSVTSVADQNKLETIIAQGSLITFIYEHIVSEIETTGETFFQSSESDIAQSALNEREKEIVHDTILKILSKHPFTYYFKVHTVVFDYCLQKAFEVTNKISGTKSLPTFADVRKLKFYLRRCVDLDSSFMISVKFIKLLKHLYERDAESDKNLIERLTEKMEYNLMVNIEELFVKRWNSYIIFLKNDQGDTAHKKPDTALFYLRRFLMLNLESAVTTEAVEVLRLQFDITTLPEKLDLEAIIEEITLYAAKHFYPVKNSLGAIRKDIIINNFLYKIKVLNMLPGFLIFLYKECIFKNHYRSIKLEQLLNSDELLPAAVKSSFLSHTDFIQKIRDPYYQLTGIIKAENLLLISQLKDLHKTKYDINYQKRLQGNLNLDEIYSKWMNPNSPAEIKEYYFGIPKIKQKTKSDPVIINSGKFLNNSRHENNSLHHENIKLSVSNMLHTATLLNDTRQFKNDSPGNLGLTSIHDIQNPDSNPEADFVTGIHNILKSIVSILQPGIAEPLDYTLCVRYSNNSSDEKSMEGNIYIISSDKATDNSTINSSGLIYNLMHGLYFLRHKSRVAKRKAVAERLIGEQSLLIGFKSDNLWNSFKEDYLFYEEKPDKEFSIQKKSFNDLFQKDCRKSPDGSGLPVFNDSNMALLLRLSELNDEKGGSGEFDLEGKAVLIISSKEKFNQDSFLQFMSNEKVRLLLMIKEELLAYLQKKVESDAFFQLLKEMKRKEFLDSMYHGVPNYFMAMEHFLQKCTLTGKEILMLDFIKEKLKSHLEVNLKSFDANLDKSSYLSYGPEDIADIFDLIMSIPCLSQFTYGKENYSLAVPSQSFKCHPILIRQVIPEIMVNMRRAADYLSYDFFNYTIIVKNNRLHFINAFDPDSNPIPTSLKTNGGKNMCEKILQKLNIKHTSHQPETGKYEVILYLND